MGEYPFSIVLYLCDGGIKGPSPTYNGLEQLLEWFVLSVLTTSASSCWHKSCWLLVLEDTGKGADGRMGA